VNESLGAYNWEGLYFFGREGLTKGAIERVKVHTCTSRFKSIYELNRGGKGGGDHNSRFHFP